MLDLLQVLIFVAGAAGLAAFTTLVPQWFTAVAVTTARVEKSSGQS
jgi:hypothetical protein